MLWALLGGKRCKDIDDADEPVVLSANHWYESIRLGSRDPGLLCTHVCAPPHAS